MYGIEAKKKSEAAGYHQRISPHFVQDDARWNNFVQLGLLDAAKFCWA
jgi:hypothetical protein